MKMFLGMKVMLALVAGVTMAMIYSTLPWLGMMLLMTMISLMFLNQKWEC